MASFVLYLAFRHRVVQIIHLPERTGGACRTARRILGRSWLESLTGRNGGYQGARSPVRRLETALRSVFQRQDRPRRRALIRAGRPLRIGVSGRPAHVPQRRGRRFIAQETGSLPGTGRGIVCRETTVRQGVVTRAEEYQAVYRSLEVYSRIFSESGLSAVTTQQNTPYVLLQMGCEFVKKWKAWIPKPLQLIPLVGRLAYRALRIGYPWIIRVPGAFRLQYPTLTNHFFVLQTDVSDLQGTSSEGISNQETSSAV